MIAGEIISGDFQSWHWPQVKPSSPPSDVLKSELSFLFTQVGAEGQITGFGQDCTASDRTGSWPGFWEKPLTAMLSSSVVL